ncbi:hypothetical protein COO60DRAFT_1638541 [Scenedesmus sp. NREL 46B-D3]|nr:hypothetical protein COO60DRAFT_1638541 [Scenedesmus sp. NREL 46B-D3]
MLDAILQQQAARSGGTLVAWVQQQPEQLLGLRSSLQSCSAQLLESAAEAAASTGVGSGAEAGSHSCKNAREKAAAVAMCSSSNNSSPPSSSRCVQTNIPAYHQGMLQLLPGGQAYLDAAAAMAAGQLLSLAAAHPQAYTAFFYCYLRIPVLPAENMLVASRLLSHAVTAVLGSAAALSNTAAVAGLASALTSLLADAMEAAGPEVYLRSLLGKPEFPATQHLLPALGAVGTAPPAFTDGDSAAAAAAAAGSGGIGVAHVSICSQRVRWGYLLQLQQTSPRWAAAVANYGAQQPNWEDVAMGLQPRSAAAAEQRMQQYEAAIGLCRALAAAAPLPVVCNHPSCDNFAGVSEAAAASKACSGCRYRYCSVACQRADRKRHKRACRSMAAAGEATGLRGCFCSCLLFHGLL